MTDPGKVTVECWQCGGEGGYGDCFDGCCLEADEGCDDCWRTCDICHGKGAYQVPADSDAARDALGLP